MLKKENNKMEFNVIDLRGNENWMSDTFNTLFTVAGHTFSSVYQYIVYSKALLNGRKDLIYAIKRTSDIRVLREIDSEISVYDVSYWRNVYNDCRNIATIQKFNCNKELKDKLLGTSFTKRYSVVGGRVDFSLLSSVQLVLQMEG